MTEFVTIKHPDLEETGTASREAFEKVWKEKGFELVDEESEEAATEQRQVTRRASQTQNQREESKKEQKEQN